MSRRHFGTDGIRGVANAKLPPELAFFVGQAAGRWMQRDDMSTARAVLGADTRRSGSMLGAAISAGMASAGVDVVDLGIAPTPAVAFVARTGDYGLGVIVSASHNPAPDNGIKFVGPDGRKLPDSVEVEIEAMLQAEFDRPIGSGVGVRTESGSEVGGYLEMLRGIVPGGLGGMRVAVDGAHGAAFSLGPQILRDLGADVVTIGVQPDGLNINAEGGATKPETIQQFTVESKAHVGVAFDGDADRVVFSDEQGRLINGDRTMGIWAAHRQRAGQLHPTIVVGTVMSNGGFERYLTGQGIALERTPVGDKYVAERLATTGALVGGEQSGHIIFPQHGPTGDGLATMLELLGVLRAEGRAASEFYADYEPWPQVLVNIGVAQMEGWRDAVQRELEESEAELGSEGRLLVRASGTQPMIRVMVEASTYDLRDRAADRIVEALIERCGGEIHGRVDLTHALGD